MHNIIKYIRKILFKSPLWLCFCAGKAAGFLLYASRKKRFIAFKNLKLVFPDKSPGELKFITRRSFEYFGLSLIETLIADRICRDNRVQMKGNFPEKGSILIGIHAGSWELINIFFARKQDFSVLVKRQRSEKLDNKLNELRTDNGLHICFTLKEAIQKLRKGISVGMVVDQGAEKNALMVDFFSHPVPTPKGAVYLAKKNNRKLYPCFGHRRGFFKHTLEIGDPVDLNNTDTEETLRNINAIYENYIRRYPWEYFWWYKRFKHRSDRNVLILSDEKLGHLKQARSLFMFLSKNSKYSLKKKEVVVRYKNSACRLLADLCASFSGKHCLGCGRCMNTVLDSSTSCELRSIYADLVISSGSFSAPANKLFSSYVGAKSVTILRPNFGLNRFTYALIPYHDRLQGKNIVNFTGSLFYPQDVDKKVRACEE
ncbi:MAG: hypothetical protein GF375_07585, partial [Candidatus Omnitrophica bacterium]|nr:hypothetical protein [Candidatus Omnitrophota bacterium]MBD3269832.1 hypothetical protein [Candidatus Omnitrophota bacterium]